MDWLQLSLAICMGFVGLESIASGLRVNVQERGWLGFWAGVWALVAAGVVAVRLIRHFEDAYGFYVLP